MGKRRKRPRKPSVEKMPGRSPMPPPGFSMRDRRHQDSEREVIEEQLEEEYQDWLEEIGEVYE